MRITYLHQYFNTLEMAGSTRSYEMARRLAAGGHEVNLITSRRKPDSRREWFQTREDGISVFWLPVPYDNTFRYRRRIKAFFRFAAAAARKAAAIPADLIFATSTPLTIALPGAWAAARQKVPLVLEVRDLWPELPVAVGALKNPVARRAAFILERFAYSRSRRIVALSPGIREGILKSGYPAERIAVIPNSADLDFFDPRRADPGRFLKSCPELSKVRLVVYAGTMGAINGVEYVPKIAGASLDQGLPLCFAVVGEGREAPKVEAMARQLGVLGKNFFMFPAVPKKEMPDILAAADVALSLFIDLEAMWANSANKFFDALASGTPVAVNYGGWQRDLILEKRLGLVLPPDDPAEAARRLGNFVADPTRMAEAGLAARKTAEAQFNRDDLARQLEGVLRSAVAGRP